MSGFILALLGLGVAFAFIGSDSDDVAFADEPPEDDEPPAPPVNPTPVAPEPDDPNPEAPPPDPDDPTPVDPTPEPPTVPSIEDMMFDVSDGDTITGGDGDDVFFTSSDRLVVDLSGGDGDDSFLFDESNSSGRISGGDGDDFVDLNGSFYSVSGGAGNDTIQGAMVESRVFGNEGDDLIEVTSNTSDLGMGVFGGDGNDTINAAGFVSWGIFGGDGDDLIITRANSDPGDGDQISASVDAGLGDDTLAHRVGIVPEPGIAPPASGPDLTGGEGSDRFEISLVSEPILGSSGGLPDDIDVIQNPGGTITDFEQGVDEIAIDLSEIPQNFDVESGTMVEDTERGQTTVTIRLLPASDADPTQDVILTINETGLSWDDIVFEGTPPPTLSMG